MVLESGGAGGSSTQDWPLLGRVARFARALSYDRAGLGWSDPAPAPRTFTRMADDLDALLAAAGEAPPFVLAGGSFGGLLALGYCRRFPHQVAGAVILDAVDEAKYFPTMRRVLPGHEAEPRIAAATGLDAMTKAGMRHVLGLRSHYEAALEEIRAVTRATADETSTRISPAS